PKPISFLKPRTQHFSSNTEFTFKSIINPQSRTHICYSLPNLDEVFNSRNSRNETFELCNTFARWVCGLKSFFPGGSWWDLSGHEEIDEGVLEKTKKNTVLAAVERMWALIGDDRWVVFVAFGSLIVAAISEISMPNLLATSIFSAQNGQTVVFNRNCQLLLLLCFVSGICSAVHALLSEVIHYLTYHFALCGLSGLRNGCFGVANTILVKRLRENLYAVLTYQVPVLRHLNFSVQPNEIVAIVGPSGSGKSTLINLLLRLYEPTNGKILVDGFPLKELDIRWLRHNIGFVGQEPHLFNMDIISNICYGCTADLKQEDVEGAAKLAHVHEFISSLPNGYRTLVDDSLLSGGQKQRIAIARAILRDTPILILDEATSALDAESEHYIKEVIQALGHNCEVKRTIIVIAHRLSTAKICDRIIVMDGGQIVEGLIPKIYRAGFVTRGL
ncbi:ABC transporter-like, ATP-binding domain, partial [Dillenia turbinata]